jgi:hypothetical protein
VKSRAACAVERIGGCVEEGRELAGGEGVEGAEASGKLRGGQTALAIEAAEEILRAALALLRVALRAAGDQVAVGVLSPTSARDDMVETSRRSGEPTETIEAAAALARVDGLAKGRAGHEDLSASDCARLRRWGANRADLLRQAHFYEVTAFAAFHYAQGAMGHEAAYGLARGRAGNAGAAGKPLNGELKAAEAFEAAVAQEVRIDGAIGDGEAQPRNEKVFEVFPNLFGIGFFVFHGASPDGQRERSSPQTGIWDD